MRRWTFPVALAAQSRTPVFVQIARAVADDVGRGRLRPGDPLPGSRTLARTLAVHRSTVIAAYDELCAQGWAVTRPGAATVIATTSPDVPPASAGPRRRVQVGVPAVPGFVLPAAPEAFPGPPAMPPDLRPGTIALWGGVPDVRLVPTPLLGRALRRAARLQGRALLGYSADRRGHARLRAELARMLSATRAIPAGADDVFVTQGSQLGLHLVARALVRPGDVVAVEAIGYRAAWGAFARAGARLVPVPIDDEGLDVAALAALARRQPRLRALHITPQHQYPTTVGLSPRRRTALLELGRAHGFAIVEDDYDHEFHFDGRPALPLAGADPHGVVVYIGSLAKILAPGLRIGFVVAPRALLDRLDEERAFVDRHGCLLVEAAVAELLEDGEVERHARRARRIYQRRRDAMVKALGRHLGGALTFRVPPGGMSLWARAADGIDVDAWQRRAAGAGARFQTGGAFTFDGAAAPFLRLGFAVVDEREIETAVKRIARSLALK